jgi:hypothetical protein
MNGHRSNLTKKPFLPVCQHFGLSDHSLEDFNRMKILVIEQNCLWSDFQRENRERFWIKELRVLHPDGIQKTIGFYVSTKYLVLFSGDLTGIR